MTCNAIVAQYGPLAGRVLLVLIFLISAYGILTNFSGTVGFYASVGIPFATAVAALVLIVKVVGSLMVATGIHARIGALALIAFVILATLIAHIGEGQLMNALKNIAIIGGLLLIVVHGAGPLTLSKSALRSTNKQACLTGGGSE